MVLIIIYFFAQYFPEIAKSKNDIQIDFDIQIDVPNYNHNVSSKMQQQRSPSSVIQKLVSRHGNGPRYKVQKTKSRSLTESTKEGATANTKIVSKNDDTATDSSNEGSEQESTNEGGTANIKIVSKNDDTVTDSSNEDSVQESTKEGGTANIKIVSKNDNTATDSSIEDSGQESTKEGGTANTKIVSKNDDTATDASNEGSDQETDMIKCCREKGVSDTCFDYCVMERNITGICEEWVKQIGRCRKELAEPGRPCDACGTCTDEIQNQDETGIDCGGTCGACPTCDDKIQNQEETGIDCGGPCDACPTCDDRVQNQDETGIDCGGACGACPGCNDGIQNQDETGIDCGGPCPACKNFLKCIVNEKGGEPKEVTCQPPYDKYCNYIDKEGVVTRNCSAGEGLWQKVRCIKTSWFTSCLCKGDNCNAKCSWDNCKKIAVSRRSVNPNSDTTMYNCDANCKAGDGECESNADCPDYTACENRQCINPCSIKDTCAPRATCKVVWHEPVCTCPDGYVGNPQISCELRCTVFGQAGDGTRRGTCNEKFICHADGTCKPSCTVQGSIGDGINRGSCPEGRICFRDGSCKVPDYTGGQPGLFGSTPPALPIDVHCKDDSPRCMTMPKRYCSIPTEANFCRRACGLCYANHLHGLPPVHSRGKP